MVIDEDLFPPVASINTTTFELRALIDSKKTRRITTGPKIRNLWIPKQYLISKNDLIVERRVSAVRENKKNGRNPKN